MSNAGPKGPVYLIVHPLDDTPEIKVDVRALGPMLLTRATRIALGLLRCYLLIMGGLVAYRVFTLMFR